MTGDEPRPSAPFSAMEQGGGIFQFGSGRNGGKLLSPFGGGWLTPHWGWRKEAKFYLGLGWNPRDKRMFMLVFQRILAKSHGFEWRRSHWFAGPEGLRLAQERACHGCIENTNTPAQTQAPSQGRLEGPHALVPRHGQHPPALRTQLACRDGS